MSVFGRLAPNLQHAIVNRLGWSSLRPVQELAGEALLCGSNAIILAPTAGGKTEASLFPLLSDLVERPTATVGALYIAPIKALLNNQETRLGVYTEMVGMRRFVWHGDTTPSQRKAFLQEPAQLLMTTPESLEVMLVSRSVDERMLFADLRAVVIDEVHALAGIDRGAHLMSVLERLQRLSRHDVQRIGLSATVGNPRDIADWLQGTSLRPTTVVDPPAPPRARRLNVLLEAGEAQTARAAAQIAHGHKSLLFCQSRARSEAIAQQMRQRGTDVFVHHSAVSKEERLDAEKEFQAGSDACVVCTSTLELGIDVGDLDLVLQSEAPDTVSSFLQRLGRTGRRTGQVPNMTFFCENAESVLQAAALMELAKNGWVERVRLTTRCWPVFVHQLLLLCLKEDGVVVDDAWAQLSRVPDFSGITREEFERLLQWMIEDESLILASGRLVVGAKVERKFGRFNFMSLYAVFSSPQTYVVQSHNRRTIGTLTQDFVDSLVPGVSCFLLGGRPWLASTIDHRDRLVSVQPGPRGRQPTWGGFLPVFLGRKLCTQMKALLSSDARLPGLTPAAQDAVDEYRADLSDVLASGADGYQLTDRQLEWFTFAGGRINTTLRASLRALQPDWMIVLDNFSLKIRGNNLTVALFQQTLAEIAADSFWQDERIWTEIAASLPDYRLSKFQTLLPPEFQRELLACELLNRSDTRQWLQEWLMA
ncbi:MAG: DEAD/DEAH box helicase [Planctomycetaceae bacterium]|nr:DEAD/DEAH box helicase [Planctomycetaceae bacterium]